MTPPLEESCVRYCVICSLENDSVRHRSTVVHSKGICYTQYLTNLKRKKRNKYFENCPSQKKKRILPVFSSPSFSWVLFFFYYVTTWKLYWKSLIKALLQD